MPWKLEHSEIYRKRVNTFLTRLESKLHISEYEQRRIDSLRRELAALDQALNNFDNASCL